MKRKSLLLELLYPPKCLFCRKLLPPGASWLCEACRSTRTGMRMSRTGKYYLRCCVPMRYEGPVRDALLRYKFEGRDCYAETLGQILAETVREELSDQYDELTWVPISPQRLRERGYDQARLLAEAVGRCLGKTPMATLEKTRNNPRQSGMADEKARRDNVKNAYSPLDPDWFRGKRLLLIDDIITTGATLDEAARTLRRAGAKDVVAAALAQPVT